MFACALACLTAGSRMLLSLGHDGLLPKVFTRTTKHTHAPDVAIWAVAIPMTVVPVAYILAGSTDTTLTGEEGTIATYGFMLAYGLVALAVPIYLRKIGENKPLAWVLGILGAVTMVFVFYVNWIPTVIPNDIFPPADRPCQGTAVRLPRLDRARPCLVPLRQVHQARGRPLRRHLGRRVRPERRRRGGRPPPTRAW